MEFEAYLTDKKIDTTAFKKTEPQRWADFERIFMQMHPKSFTMQKLNLINSIRRKFPLKESGMASIEGPEKKKMMKPKMSPSKPGTGAKPKMGKPKTDAKPKMGKPKINVGPKGDESKQTDKSASDEKPKMMKPKMGKPKIKPRTDVSPKSEEQKQEDKPKKPKVKPVIKRPKTK